MIPEASINFAVPRETQSQLPCVTTQSVSSSVITLQPPVSLLAPPGYLAVTRQLSILLAALTGLIVARKTHIC